MTPSIILLFRFLNILLVIPGQQCLVKDIESITTVTTDNLPIISYASPSTRISTGETRPIHLKSDTEPKTLLVKRQINKAIFRYGKAILPSSTRTRDSITPRLQTHHSNRRHRRAFLPGNLADLLNSQAGPFIRRQLSQPAVSVATTSRSISSSRAPTPTPTPTQVMPTPTQVANNPNDASKPRPAEATSTTSLNAKSTASIKHPSSVTDRSPKSTAISSQPSQQPSPKSSSDPQSSLSKFASHFKLSSRLAPLAIVFTVVLAFGGLVTLVSVLKCFCHKKRFANKKDYPEGFPWLPSTPESDTETKRTEETGGKKEQLYYNTSHTSTTRVSIAPSAHPSHHLSYYADYQLNDLRSPSDVNAHYSFPVPPKDPINN